ncbi:MAG: GNAT family N-acetyltransferase [Pseudonocardiaceae bacterium]
MIDVRQLHEPEFRPAHSLFRGALHQAPASDEHWQHTHGTYQPGRALGAFEGTEMVGTALSFAMRMTVPGGADVPMAGVTNVGVRADRTRRGALTALMRTQLEQLREQGDVAATLRASESPIYERFGYGVATRGRDIEVDLNRAGWREGAPTGGDIRLLAPEQIRTTLPEVHRRLPPRRPGAVSRPDHWWDVVVGRPIATGDHVVAAVHSGPDGDNGFAVWTPERDPRSEGVLIVRDLVAGSASAHAGLWRLLASIDLVAGVRARLQPLDDELDLLVADSRGVHTTGIEDEVWLRLLDVPAALSARSYGAADPVVIEVHDALLPANAGCYRVGPDGAEPVDAEPDLSLDVSQLAMAYLGDRAPSVLAQAGRIAVSDPTAAARADALLRTGEPPWCGTYF